jgi:dTMP kinase
MLKTTYPGKFIVFEGLDGAGKSTQALRLLDYLRDTRGIRAHYTSEPTPHLIGGLIRSQIRGDWHSSNECLQLLFSADRLYHLEKEVIPLLEQGIHVLCDRYFLSTAAYGEDMEWLLGLNQKVLLPDIMFLLEMSPEKSIERIHSNRTGGIHLFEKTAILAQVASRYATLKERFADIVVPINGERTIDEVTKDIQKVVEQRL